MRLADAGPGEREHPADVRGHDEVPRWPQHVCPQDRTRRDRALDRRIAGAPHAHPERPFGIGVFLRLHGAKPAHHFVRTAEAAASEPLVEKARVQDIDGPVLHHGLLV
jgi:hypothetical protein